jgi:hypothetical protein
MTSKDASFGPKREMGGIGYPGLTNLFRKAVANVKFHRGSPPLFVLYACQYGCLFRIEKYF